MMPTPPSDVRRPGQDGSITVMITLVLPILMLMLVMIININQLFCQKIRLQATVDACALSAAAVQAAGLNEIADLNRDMAIESEKLMGILMGGTWYNSGAATRAKNFFYNGATGVLDFIYRYQTKANEDFALKSDMIAQNVKLMNMPECRLIPRHAIDTLASFTVKKNQYYYWYYTMNETSPLKPPVPTRQWFNPDDPRFIGSHDGSITLPAKRILPLMNSFRVPFELKKQSITQADYEIIMPVRDFLFGKKIFGPMPELRARATAKPAGGYISGGVPSYEAVLIN
ncbi:MAG: pilus assembly protein TadG-related protein [Pseudomonadota bacterium]